MFVHLSIPDSTSFKCKVSFLFFHNQASCRLITEGMVPNKVQGLGIARLPSIPGLVEAVTGVGEAADRQDFGPLILMTPCMNLPSMAVAEAMAYTW